MPTIRFTQWLVAPCAASLLVFTASGAELLVPATYPTIQSAVDAAVDGDTILVSSGTYAEAVLVQGKSIDLVGVDGAATTIVDGAGFASPVVEIGGDGLLDVGLKGLTLRNGSGKLTGTQRDGGGIHFAGWRLTVQQCVLDHNSATRRGGGAFLGAGAQATWSDCVFSDNTCMGGSVASGAGVCMSPFGGTCAFAGCTFTGNVAMSTGNGGSGGGAFVLSAIFERCTFENNVAAIVSTPTSVKGGGGGLYAADVVTLTDCHFTTNQGGGAACFGGGDDVNMVCACTFTGNTGFPYGGGLLVNGANVALQQCSFTGNVSTKDGGALDVNIQATLSAIECSFVGNEAINGGGVVVVGAKSASFTSCAFSRNVADGVGGGMAVAAIGAGTTTEVADCTISGNEGDAGGGVYVTMDGGLTVVDTLVCDNSPENFDGPWIDAGGNDICADGPPADINGDGAVDGADLGILLSQWSTIGPAADLNNDFVVDGLDLGLLLAGWT